MLSIQYCGIRTLDKLLQKGALWSLIHLEKNTHYMVRLFPTVEGFLEVLTALVNEELDRARVGNESVCFKFLADTVSNVGRCNGDGVQGDDFGCLLAFRCETCLRQSSGDDSPLEPSLCRGQ